LSEFKSEKVIAFLSERWGNRACPMCGKGPWSVQDKIFQLSEFHQGSLVVGGPLIPVVPVTCGNCGNTVLVNALISGGMQPELPTAEKKE